MYSNEYRGNVNSRGIGRPVPFLMLEGRWSFVSGQQCFPHSSELKDYLEYVNSGETIYAPSEELAFSGYLTQEALKITAVMNSGYHEPEELQDLFAELTGQEINRTLGLITPFYTDCGKNIHIGEHVFINTGCTMQDQGGVYIGDGALIGHHCMIATLNHEFAPDHRQELHPKPVRIGRNVWIGANVTILPGVTIGNGAIVSAGAVVTKDVAENTIVAGVPAKKVRDVG